MPTRPPPIQSAAASRSLPHKPIPELDSHSFLLPLPSPPRAKRGTRPLLRNPASARAWAIHSVYYAPIHHGAVDPGRAPHPVASAGQQQRQHWARAARSSPPADECERLGRSSRPARPRDIAAAPATPRCFRRPSTPTHRPPPPATTGRPIPHPLHRQRPPRHPHPYQLRPVAAYFTRRLCRGRRRRAYPLPPAQVSFAKPRHVPRVHGRARAVGEQC
jgi:hypothetical protein